MRLCISNTVVMLLIAVYNDCAIGTRDYVTAVN